MPILGNVIKRALQLRKRARFVKAKPMQYQKKVLKRLLTEAEETVIGREYGFSEIIESEDIVKIFQERVPLHNYYGMFSKWWSRAKNGEEDVVWPGKVKYFALSSGTSDASTKFIPVTKDMLRTITRASIKQAYSMTNYKLPSDVFEKGVLLLGSSSELHDRGDHFEGDMSGISLNRAIPFWMNRIFKPGKDILQTTDWNTKLDLIARNAKKWDISIITGIPAWMQIMIEKVMDYHKVDSIHEIWPNLSVYIHGGIAFEPYKKTFEKFFTKPVAYIETYMASEGYFAFRSHPDNEGLSLILNNNIFYEFLPFNSDNFDANGEMLPHAKPLTIDEVEEGVDYAMLLTTCSGAWRYLIGDTVRFTDAKNKQILITGRTKHFLSICGEHLSVDNMTKAVKMAGEALDVEIQEFTVQGIPYQNLFAHKWYIGTKEKVDVARLREILDEKLKEVNDDYATERANVLKEIIVEVVPNDLFYKWLKKLGKEGDQYKIPRVMKKDQFRDWEEFVAQDLAVKDKS